jgi:hypothetical protein
MRVRIRVQKVLAPTSSSGRFGVGADKQNNMHTVGRTLMYSELFRILFESITLEKLSLIVNSYRINAEEKLLWV